MSKNVLIVHNMEPKTNRPSGIFVHEQIEDLRIHCPSVKVTEFTIRLNKSKIFDYLNPVPLLKTIRSIRPDVIHCHYGLTLLPMAICALISSHVRVLITFHGSDLSGSRLVNFISNLCCWLCGADKIVVSSSLISKLWRVNKNNVTVLPCALRANSCSLDDSSSLKDIVLLFPADPERKVKNFSGFLYVIRELQKLDFCVKVIFLTNIRKQNVLEVIKKCNALVLVSHSEGSPQIVKEALAAQRPVFALDVGDVKQLIQNVDGCYVAGDIATLIQNLKSAILSVEILDKKQVDNALEDFESRTIAENLERIYLG